MTAKHKRARRIVDLMIAQGLELSDLRQKTPCARAKEIIALMAALKIEFYQVIRAASTGEIGYQKASFEGDGGTDAEWKNTPAPRLSGGEIG